MVNTAQQGRRIEHLVRHDLEANGYTVMRSAGSKGAVDLLAMKPNQMLFVQVKRSGTLPPVQWNRLFDLAWMFPGLAIPVLAEKMPGRPIRYYRLLGRKDAPGRQPYTLFEIDYLTQPTQ